MSPSCHSHPRSISLMGFSHPPCRDGAGSACCHELGISRGCNRVRQRARGLISANELASGQDLGPTEGVLAIYLSARLAPIWPNRSSNPRLDCLLRTLLSESSCKAGRTIDPSPIIFPPLWSHRSSRTKPLIFAQFPTGMLRRGPSVLAS